MLYTRKGDAGLTDLADGSRTPKTDPRIEAAGTLDELCSELGLLLALTADSLAEPLAEERSLLIGAQRFLFAIGAWVTGARRPQALPQEADVAALERAIDRMEHSGEAAFRGFILPGGHPVAARCHVCRTVTRRAERDMLRAGAATLAAGAEAMPYLNRLSDFLYALSGKINHTTGFSEIKW